MNNRIISLKPLSRFIMTIGELPSSYLASMTYEEQLLWLGHYLQTKVIPAINENGKVVEELQQAFNELKDYINNYFDNLDLQEEVNNKIEDLLESGQLQEIITQYLEINGVLGYNTVANMVSATNLIDGSICRTLGKLDYMDGYGEFYKIRTLLNTDVVDGENIIALENFTTLIAEKIPDAKIEEIINSINELAENVNEQIETFEENVNEQIETFEENVNEQINALDEQFKFYEPVLVKTFGHRGLASSAPGNTIAGIIKAGLNGNYGVELDLQVTADGEIILMHDASVDSTTTGTGIVNELSYAYISSLTINSGAQLTSLPTQNVPTLEEALKYCVKYNLIPMLELKENWNAQAYNKLISLIKLFNMEDKAIIGSFDTSLLTAIRELNSKINMIIITTNAIDEELIQSAITLKRCGISADYNSNSSISLSLRQSMIENNVPFGLWVINDQSIMRNAINNNNGISFVLSDYGLGNYNSKPKRMIGVISSNGFQSWNTQSGGSASVAYQYDNFSVSVAGTDYNVIYTNPIYTPLTGYYGTPIALIQSRLASNFRCVCSTQSQTGFTLRFVNNTTNQYVSVADVVAVTGTTYITILV